MNPLTALKSETAAFLRRRFFDEGVTVVSEFPPERRAEGGSVAVGIGGVERMGAGAGQVKLTLRFDILCASGARFGCHAIFDRLCELLICEQNNFGFRCVTCGEMKFDRELGGVLLRAQAIADGLLVDEPDYTGEPFREIEIQTRGV